MYGEVLVQGVCKCLTGTKNNLPFALGNVSVLTMETNTAGLCCLNLFCQYILLEPVFEVGCVCGVCMGCVVCVYGVCGVCVWCVCGVCGVCVVCDL